MRLYEICCAPQNVNGLERYVNNGNGASAGAESVSADVNVRDASADGNSEVEIVAADVNDWNSGMAENEAEVD